MKLKLKKPKILGNYFEVNIVIGLFILFTFTKLISYLLLILLK